MSKSLFTASILAIIILTVFVLSAVGQASDGVMKGVNLQRTNAYDEIGTDKVGSVLWRTDKLFRVNYAASQPSSFDISNTIYSVGFSDPIFYEGALYFELCLGRHKSFLFSLNGSDGKPVWRYDAKDPISAPAIAGDAIYVMGSDGFMYCLDIRTGKENWKLGLKGTWSDVSAPAVYDGLVYVIGTYAQLYAVDAKTGTLKWSFKGKSEMLALPAFFDGTAYIGTGKEELVALDLKTQVIKWTAKLKGIPSFPVATDKAILVRTTQGNLYSIDRVTGEQRLLSNVGGGVTGVFPVTRVIIGSALAVQDGTVFFTGFEKQDHFLFAIDITTGKVKWRLKTTGPSRSPIMAKGLLYLGVLGGIYAVDAATGQQNFFLKSESDAGDQVVKDVVSSPAVHDKTIYFVNDAGSIFALK